MPRAGEMVEKIDTREHAPAIDAADLSTAAAYPDSFWQQQAAERAATSESQSHSPAGSRASDSPESSSAERTDSDEAPDPSSREQNAAPTDGTEQSSPEAPAAMEPGSASAEFSAQASVGIEQEAATQDVLGSGSSQIGGSVQTNVAIGADVSSNTSASDLSAVQPVADIAAAPTNAIEETLSTALDAASEPVESVLSDAFAVAASPLETVEELVVDHGATSVLSSLFQPTADSAASIPNLDTGSLTSLEEVYSGVADEAAVDVVEEVGSVVAPLPGALLGSDDEGGDVDGLIGF